MKTLLTALLVIWLLAGCQAAPQADEDAATAEQASLSYCPELMWEVYQYDSAFDRLVVTDDPQEFDAVRLAALRIAALSDITIHRMPASVALENHWLSYLQQSALGFHTATSPMSDYVAAIQAYNALSHGIIRATSACEKAAL